MQRPVKSVASLENTVKKVFADVRKNGDAALKKYTLLFDKVKVNSLKLNADELATGNTIPSELKNAIRLAKKNIEAFHSSQKEKVQVIETMQGVKCWRESRAIEKVGIYILAGFFIQLLLEFFSTGIEHGHAHIHSHDKKIPFSVLAGLFIHSMLEGMPIRSEEHTSELQSQR